MSILLLKNHKIAKNNEKHDEILDKVKDAFISFGETIIERDIEEKDINDSSVSMVVAVGGDGTIMKGAKLSHKLKAPIFGINAGHLGFLAGVDYDNDIKDSIKNIIDKKYKIDSRPILDVSIMKEDGSIVFNDLAINEAICLATDLNEISNFKVYIGKSDNLLYDFSSSGVIVSTPTGSTAFCFSAGGPIVSPRVGCFIIQAIYPHAFYQRSIVVEDEKKLYIVIPDYNQSLYIDGRKLRTLEKNDTIILSKSKEKIDFVEFDDDIFYKNIKNKIRNI